MFKLACLVCLLPVFALAQNQSTHAFLILKFRLIFKKVWTRTWYYKVDLDLGNKFNLAA